MSITKEEKLEILLRKYRDGKIHKLEEIEEYMKVEDFATYIDKLKNEFFNSDEEDFGIFLDDRVKKLENSNKQIRIDKALQEYRENKITLDDYIKVCKNNLQNKEIKHEDSKYNHEISRNSVLNFKDYTVIKTKTENEIYTQIESYLKCYLELADIDTDIIGIQLIGSRTKGYGKADSDLDVLIEYNNSDFGEDEIFNRTK